MEENESVKVVFDLGLESAEESLESFMQGMESLQDLAKNIGTELRKAFVPLQAVLKKTVMSVDSMTDALTEATEALQNLMSQMANEQFADQWLGGISAAIEGIDLGIGVSKIVKAMGPIGKIISKLGAMFSALAGWFTKTLVPAISGALGGIAETLGISVWWVAAIIAAIAAAIAAAVIYWDEIKLFFTDTLPQLWNQFSQWLGNVGSAVAQAFQNILSAIGSFLAACWDGIVAVFSGIGSWIQANIITPVVELFTPVVAWFAELFGSIFQTVSDVFYNIGVIICGCWEIIKAAWGVVAAWFNNTIILPVCNFFTSLWTTVSTAAVAAWNAIKAAFTSIGNWIYSNVVAPVSNFLTGMWNGFLDGARAAWEGVKAVFGKLAQFFRDVFSTAWAGVVKVFSVAGEIFTDIKEGILAAFKTIVNGLITGINTVVKIPFDGINNAIGTIRSIRVFDITPFTGLHSISVPQIPYLAKGAVLPANKPFLAMVGDQRHGTNIEAPLSTIQEAMAATMQDYIAGNMAGHEATVGVLREILEAVLGIQIGDADIARAAERYRRKMAVVHGAPY